MNTRTAAKELGLPLHRLRALLRSLYPRDGKLRHQRWNITKDMKKRVEAEMPERRLRTPRAVKSPLQVGWKMGAKIWGKERFLRMEKSGKEMHPGFWDLALMSWAPFARPGLSPKQRSLAMVAGLTVLGHREELKMHIFGALNNGASQEEIVETIVHLAPYGGIPNSRGALLVAKGCFSEYHPAPDRRG